MKNPLRLVFGFSLLLAAASLTVNAAQPGAIKWKFTTAAAAPVQSVAISGRAIYFTVRPNEIHAIDEQNGAFLWKYSSMANFNHGLIAGSDGSIVATQLGSITSLDGQAGTVNWSWSPDSGVGLVSPYSPALIGRGLLYVPVRGANGGNLMSLDLGTGILSGRESAYRFTEKVSADWDDTLYFVAYDRTTPPGYILSSRRFTTEKWKVPLYSYGVAIGYGGTLFTGANDQNVYAIDGGTGAIIWEFASNGYVESEPIVSDDGKVIFNSSDGNAYAVDSITGAKRWSLPVSRRGLELAHSPALAADGTVYIAAENRLYAVQSATGTQLWMTELTGSLGSPNIGADGTVYVASADGQLYAVYGQSSAGLAATPWPKYRQNVRNTGSLDRAYPRLTTTIIRQTSRETEIRFSGVKTDVIHLEASPDLKTWNQIGVITNTTGQASFVDDAPAPSKFYRTRLALP
jgi:outer membrane protein assembly factor BamB